jgi:beta-galactosidase
MWFHYENAGSYGLAHQGVAVCDSAPGPYKFLQHSQPNGHQSRDIGMFQDEDGKVYIGYAANNGSSINAEVRLVQLADDYLSVTTNDVVTGAHCEGPGMLKWNDKYYLLTSLCSGWDPNEASYYTCSKVLGSYTKIGSPCPSSEKKTYNSQPSSIFKIPGYSNGFLYVGDRWNGGGSTKSQNVFLPIIMTSDGKMQLKWYDEWKIATVFTASAAVDDRSPSFKKAVYENVLHKSGLHVCDLLGRNVACYYGKSPSGAVFIIDKSGVKTAPASGRYVAR